MVPLKSNLLLVLGVVLSVIIGHSGGSVAAIKSVLGDHRGISRRDSHVMGMFEVILTTLDSKLRRVENLDRAVQHLMRKMETMETRLAIKTSKIASSVDKIQAQLEDWQSPPDASLVANINSRLDQLSMKVDTLCGQASEEEYLLEQLVAQPSNRRSSLLTSNSKDSMEDVKEVVKGIDRRLGFHINIVSENLGKMTHMVEEVRDAIIDDTHQPTEEDEVGTLLWLNRSNVTAKRTKFDQLFTTLHPLLRVNDKVDEVRGMLAGTKTSVDDLVPKSEQLLSQTQRQERAISNIHNDLKEKTNAIMKELGQAERDLKPPVNAKKINTRRILRGQGITKTSLLRRQRLERGNTTLPTQATTRSLRSTTTTKAPNTSIRTTPETTPTTITRPTRTTTTRGPSVIFPSVENKPIVINTTFTYELGRNKAGVEGYSCADLYNKGLTTSGTYYLQISGTRFWYLKVYCDMETSGGGWTLMQRRDDYGEPRESFNRDWTDYKYGFGNPNREVWLGNENVHLLTRHDDYELRVEMTDFEGNERFAHYDTFRLGSENESYRLEIGGYQGTAGDSLNDPWYGSNLRPFSTFDNDNDRSSLNCASMLKGGWWWKSCGRGLNGLYLTDPQDTTARQGIVWFRWRGWDYTLKRSQMMIRPKSFAAH